MKHFLVVLAFMIPIFCGLLSAENIHTIKESNSSFIPFKIEYYAGCEDIVRYEIRVYRKEDKIFADNITPFFYYGRQTDSVWTVELNQEKMEICKKFLEKAKMPPKKSQMQSSLNQVYIITSADESFRVYDDCEWDGLDFYSVRDTLFKEKLADLELKRSNLINDLNNKIKGRWYLKSKTSNLKRGDFLILTKNDDNQTSYFWDFGDNNSFRSSGNEYLNVAYSKKYKWQINGDILFTIELGMMTNKNGDSIIGNSDAAFILDLLTDNELKIKFLWQY